MAGSLRGGGGGKGSNGGGGLGLSGPAIKRRTFFVGLPLGVSGDA